LVLGGLEAAARVYVWKKYGDQLHGMNWKFMYEPYIQTRTDDRLHQDVPPKSDAFRILVIGGSTASLIPDDLLADAFQSKLNRKVEVINMGQGAFIMNQERITLMLHGMHLKPDLLITLNGANDIVTASKTLRPGITYSNDFIALGVNRPVVNGLLGMIRNSQLLNCVNKLRERQIEGKAQVNEGLLADTVMHCQEALHSIATIAKGMDIPYAMVLQPYIHLRSGLKDDERELADAFAYRGEYMAKGIRTLSEVLPETEFPGEVFMIDGTKAFDAVEGQCFVDEVHLSEFGNEKLVDYIATAAIAQGLEPKPSNIATSAQ
jgi:hypothetical protein